MLPMCFGMSKKYQEAVCMILIPEPISACYKSLCLCTLTLPGCGLAWANAHEELPRAICAFMVAWAINKNVYVWCLASAHYVFAAHTHEIIYVGVIME
jgi:hypothetical protein